MRDAEYDRFGPWVLEISEEDPPPPLFVPYLNRTEEPLTSIKIPRKIERRIAHPGMNLYDYMVTLYEDEVVILERVGDDVRTHAYSYDDIQYICLKEELLKGTLHLSLPGHAFDLPFNTVSKDVMGNIVDLLRERYAGAARGVTIMEEAQVDNEAFSYYFNSLLTKHQAGGTQFRLLAAQPTRAVGSFESESWRKLFYGAISKTLLESLHLSDGRELKIINRSKTYKYKWQTIYSKATYLVPVEKICAVSWEADEKNTAVTHMLLETSGATIEFALLQDNPTVKTYDRFLQRMPIS